MKMVPSSVIMELPPLIPMRALIPLLDSSLLAVLLSSMPASSAKLEVAAKSMKVAAMANFATKLVVLFCVFCIVDVLQGCGPVPFLL